MKKDVNFVLFGLIITLLIAMVAITIYAQHEYKSMTGDYESALSELQDRRDELDNKSREIDNMRREIQEREQSLVDIVAQLNLSEERRTSLGGFFEDLKGEKELLESNLTKKAREVENWKSSYNAKEKDLQLCISEKELKDKEIGNLRISMAQINSTLTRFENDIIYSVDKSKEEVSKVESKVSSAKSSLDSADDAAADLEDSGTKKEIRENVDDADEYLSSVEDYLSQIRAYLDGLKRRTADTT